MERQTLDQLMATILERLKKLEEDVEQIHRSFEEKETRLLSRREENTKLSSQAISEIDFMNLPDSLRKTMMTLAKLREATPEEVAEGTSRTRGLENIYLNQLERLGYIEKAKRGKRVYFRSLRII